ncbi:hypothetical protein SBF1_50053 [Candidatus Desulfosporosinus infrequens]|uniref:Uncharacterized protein n=1 Tax=Candidatus Desulfosporosinus infrequens TaxID=2043169 RepID=A0A2U3LH76_9FIRM|nr:hypothetical protein SBF1_50053 [Candidatus Desulfosporosinus infrequens]
MWWQGFWTGAISTIAIIIYIVTIAMVKTADKTDRRMGIK